MAYVFLDSLGNTNTLRPYATGADKTAEFLGEARPLVTVADDEIRRPGGAGLGEADTTAGLADPGPLENGGRSVGGDPPSSRTWPGAGPR
ncbi:MULTISPECIES: hypothetical protein [unclassified Streptomyces]|uniref:hypothetical protein n=1 Tax=Streptomyces sp. ST1015 TaxID=1848900 RepID=UPI00195F52D3